MRRQRSPSVLGDSRDRLVLPTDAHRSALYHRRWEIEATFNEIKTAQRGAGIVLRSKSPPMVLQELYELMVRASEDEDAELERLSFIRSLRLVRRHVTDQAAFSP